MSTGNFDSTIRIPPLKRRLQEEFLNPRWIINLPRSNVENVLDLYKDLTFSFSSSILLISMESPAPIETSPRTSDVALRLPSLEPKDRDGIRGDIGRKINLMGINTVNTLTSGRMTPFRVEEDKEEGGRILRYKKGDQDIILRTDRYNPDVVIRVTVHRKDKYSEGFHEIEMGDFPEYTVATKRPASTEIFNINGYGARKTELLRLEPQKGKSPHKFLQVVVDYKKAEANFIQANELEVMVGDKTGGVENFTDMQRRGSVDRIGTVVRQIKNAPRSFGGISVLNERVLKDSGKFAYDEKKGSFVTDSKGSGFKDAVSIGGILIQDTLKPGESLKKQLQPSTHHERTAWEELSGSRGLGSFRVPDSSISQISNWKIPSRIIQ